MTPEEVKKLTNGVYRIFWKEEEGGGESVAVVGRKTNGAVWMCCANWISEPGHVIDHCGDILWGRVREAHILRYTDGKTAQDLVGLPEDTPYDLKDRTVADVKEAKRLANAKYIAEVLRLEKRKFLFDYVLNRTSTHLDFLNGEDVALEAGDAWEMIQAATEPPK